MSIKSAKALETKMQMMSAKYAERILTGLVVAIDPSAVSSSSMPGYAVFKAGEFVECGTMEIKFHVDLNIRLRRLHEAFRKAFRVSCDVLVIEKPSNVPLFSKANAAIKHRPFMNVKSINSMARAIGATVSAFREEIPVIEVSPISWHSHRKALGLVVEKTDSNDAYLIGLTVIDIARKALEGK